LNDLKKKRRKGQETAGKTQTEPRATNSCFRVSRGNIEILGKKEYFPSQKEAKSEKFKRIEVKEKETPTFLAGLRAPCEASSGS
jgi:hypothetical protein